MAKLPLGCILLISALTSLAQDVALVGPVTGWVYDPPTQAVRMISGMPGAARLGAGVLTDVAWASVAPNGRTAIVQVNDELRLITAAGDGRNISGAPVNAAIPSPQYSAWSADSSAVALYSPASRSVQWIRMRGDTTFPESPVALTGVDGDVTSFAADAVSQSIAIGVAGSGLYRVHASEGTALIAPIAGISAIAFEPQGRTVWAVERGSGQVIEVSNFSSSPTVRTLLVDSERFSDISAIALSSDRRELYLADRHTSRLYRFDRSSATLAGNIELPAEVTTMTRIGRESVLFLGHRAQPTDPVYLLTVTPGSVPTLFFVPDGGEEWR